MTIQEFAELVRNMRDAQDRYFDTRQRHHLVYAKNVEREVDKAVKEILSTQGNLLTSEPEKR